MFAVHNANAAITQDPVPTAVASSVQVTENQTYAFKVLDFGYSDPNGTAADPLASVTVTSLPSTGTLIDDGVAVTAGQVISASDIDGGNLVFAPTTNVTTTSSFNFEVTDTLDGATSANDAAMTVDIVPVTSGHHRHHSH